ncbi:MAG: hypothetical protein KatS3mg011_2127 [Acidimicrobiia bacterium]|nr:MAG: hypothetical protein KatS3mg011_2127 [Acidimicrobiia bacterium]
MRIRNPVRGLLHGGAAVASLFGLGILLAANRGGVPVGVAVTVYALSFVALFTASSLYHSGPWSEARRRMMRRLDHAAIFLAVAGTYTPIAVVGLEGTWRWATLVVVWVTAGVGMAMKLAERRVSIRTSAVLQSALGWAAVLPMWQVARTLGWEVVAWLAVGGLVYTSGMVVMATGRPRFSSPWFGPHELFHVAVVVAGAVHFSVILLAVLPAAG